MRRFLLRWLPIGGLLAGLLLAAAAAGLWVWSGSEGSLATALRWAGAYQRLTAEQVSGSLRHGGRVARLAWERGGLTVQASELELRWRARDLFHGRLVIEHLRVRSLRIDDQSTTSSPPPTTLALPLAVQLQELRIGALRSSAAGEQTVRDIQAHYAFDGHHHELVIEHLGVQGGDFHAQLRLPAQAPLTLTATLGGTLAPELPSAAAALPLTLQATLDGPLEQLQLQAEVRSAKADPPAPSPQARLTARLLPWAAQPLSEAEGTLQALDLARLWTAAPHTRLSGDFKLSPQPASTKDFRLHADLTNAEPGPWDRQQLPVQALQADVLWQPGRATVRMLQARIAGGRLHAEGDWCACTDAVDAAGWHLQARLDGVDPAALHTRFTALPLDGRVSASGAGQAIAFEAALQARHGAAAHPRSSGAAPKLSLRQLDAHGRFHPGWLTLEQVKLTSDDAQASGRLQLRWHEGAIIGGEADMTARAPGMTATLRGGVQERSGSGLVQWQVTDAASALAWLSRLPGVAAVLPAGTHARGQAQLSAHWSGGWRQPGLQAELTSTGLNLGTQRMQEVRIDQARVQVEGTLAQARLSLRAQAHQGQRKADLELSAQGGYGAADKPQQARLTSLRLQLTEPLLGPDPWRLALTEPVLLSWASPARSDWNVGAGALTITTSAAPETRATLRWGALTHARGHWSSSGELTGLPMQWAMRVLGTAAQARGLTSDVLLGGSWNFAFSDTLQLKAQLERTSGDLALHASAGGDKPQARIAAGLQQARATLTSDGRDIDLQLLWDSTHAGRLSGELHSPLMATNDAQGQRHWSWPDNAPLSGQLRARLPEIAAWSALAPLGWRLSGSLAVDVAVSGTRAAPQLAGTATADDLALRSIIDGIELTQGRLHARFADTRLVIEELSLRGTGKDGGALRANGEAGWIDGRLRAHLAATLNGLRTSLRSDRDIAVSGQLQAELQDKALNASGQLHIDHARIELPDESRPTLGSDVIVPGSHPPPGDAGQARESAAPASWTAQVDVGIDLGDDFRVSGMGADTLLTGQLRLSARGPLTQAPQLTGLVQTRRGRFRAYGQDLDITRGYIRFTGEIDNPALDIIALRPNFASDQKAGVQVSGSALLPRIRLYSDPALPDSQTLAWLLLGHAAPTDGAESAMLQSAAIALLGGREGRSLASRFGLDELSVARGDSGAVANTSITLGKRLSERLYAAYEHSLAGTGSTLLIFYELSRRWSLRGQAGENAGLDLIYRLSFD
jgi:translocation and assembly module TamB